MTNENTENTVPVNVVKFLKKDMDVNKYERLSSLTLRHKIKKRNSAFIAVLHFTISC